MLIALWGSFKPASGAPPWIASRARASQNVEARPLLAQFHELIGRGCTSSEFCPSRQSFLDLYPGKLAWREL